jgi:2-keto-myo-inositol isomerase
MASSARFPFKTALNSGTIMSYRLDVKQQIDVAYLAGYEGIELWLSDIEAYRQDGGQLIELKKYINDKGLKAANAIAFVPWADGDPKVREKGLEQAKREMDMLLQIGCFSMAAPPCQDTSGVTLDQAAEYFAGLNEVAEAMAVVPYLEIWGRAPVLLSIAQALYVAAQSRQKNVRILLDLFQMYIGGSDIHGVELMHANSIGIVHVNDYPAIPARNVIEDSERVFPGDGIGPSGPFAGVLNAIGYNGYLSLELIDREYPGKSAVDAAREGLDKMKKAYRI